MMDRIILRVNFFLVLFFEHVKNCKLHKTRPGSFFAQLNHFIKAELQSLKSISLIRHKQISHSAEHTCSLKFKLQTHSGAELMQVFFPATS
jgi:tRNA(Leu) C34 or U34 (ribose-2'-O)-methylase TrmL